ncbi:hypothetical protein [Roseateles sp. P5_E7]
MANPNASDGLLDQRHGERLDALGFTAFIPTCRADPSLTPQFFDVRLEIGWNAFELSRFIRAIDPLNLFITRNRFLHHRHDLLLLAVNDSEGALRFRLADLEL